jgi:hypothetical protein
MHAPTWDGRPETNRGSLRLKEFLALSMDVRTVPQMTPSQTVQSLIQSAQLETDPVALLLAARQQHRDVARLLLDCQIRWVGTHTAAQVCRENEPETDLC